MQIEQPNQRLNLLLEILSEQLKLHHQLFILTQKEKTAITGFKSGMLDDVISEKNYLVQMLKEIEHRRMSLMAEIGDNLMIAPKQLTLRRLAELVDSETAKELLSLREKLLDVMIKLQNENNNNKQLMTHFISLVDHSIKMLGSVLSHDSTYVCTGQYATEQGGGVILSGKF